MGRLFNDGPNIARSAKQTEVINILREEQHREIDDEKDVQSEIISHIDEVIGEFKHKKKFDKMKKMYESFAGEIKDDLKKSLIDEIKNEFGSTKLESK